MSHWSDIQDKIVAKLQTISSVKNVKKNWQRVDDTEEYFNLFGVAVENDATEKRIHTWLVVYTGAVPITDPGTVELGTYHVTYRYELHGFLNFMQDGDSEHVLRDIVQDIIAAFVPYKSMGLDGSSSTPVIGSSISVDNFNLEQFGPVFCSHAKVTITVTVWVGNVIYT